MLQSPVILTAIAALAALVNGKTTRSMTPLMGWNSYNKYGCNPSEQIMKSNAQGIVTLGLDNLGYSYVTTDCGWNANRRDSEQRLVWNPTLFPSGGKALCDYIHGLGLKCGVYSGGGYFQCGSKDQPASLGRFTCRECILKRLLTGRGRLRAH